MSPIGRMEMLGCFTRTELRINLLTTKTSTYKHRSILLQARKDVREPGLEKRTQIFDGAENLLKEHQTKGRGLAETSSEGEYEATSSSRSVEQSGSRGQQKRKRHQATQTGTQQEKRASDRMEVDESQQQSQPGKEGRGSFKRSLSTEQEDLRASIQSLKTWQSVGPLLDQQSAALTADNIQRILYRLTEIKLPEKGSPKKAEFENLLTRLCMYAQDLLPSFRPVNTSYVLFCMSKLKYYDINLVNGLISLGLRHAGNFDGSAWARMVLALATMSHEPSEQWWNCFYRARNSLSTMTAFELSGTIRALARFGRSPPDDWSERFKGELLKNVEIFRNTEYAIVLYCIASLKLCSDQAFMDSFVSSKAARLRGMLLKDLVKVIWAVTQCTPARPSDAWIEEFATAFLKQVQFCNGPELANITYCLAYLDPGSVLSPLFYELVMRHTVRLMLTTKVNGDDLGSITLAMATLGVKQDAFWINSLISGVESRLATCSADGIAKLESAMPALGSELRVRELMMKLDKRSRVLQKRMAS